jgi:hypothetical protein
MDTYLDRPVFPFQINHASAWKGSFQFDVDEVQLGGGASNAIGIQSYRIRRLDLNARSSSLAEIETFFKYVRGRAVGFWLPLVKRSMTVLSGTDGSTFTCKGTDLAVRWGRDPAQHLWLKKAGGTGYPCKVASVVASRGNSIVTLDSALDAVPDRTWSASLLLYVRLASDDLDVKRVRYDTFTFSPTVIELPFEYSSAESPTNVIYLYAFGYSLGAVSNWTHWTNWGVRVAGTDGTSWTPAPIQHGDVQDDSEGSTTTIKCLAWNDCPVCDLFPRCEGLPLRIKIWEAKWDWDALAETGTRQLLFDGEVRKPSAEGIEISASCQAGADLYNRSLPIKVKSRTCTAIFCDAACGLSAETFSVASTVVGLTNSTRYYVDVQVGQALPDDWLLFGFVASADYHDGVPSKYWEWRPIQAVTDLGSNQYRLQLRTPFRHVEQGDTLYLYHGCAKTSAACKEQTKLDGTTVNNFYNFQGQPLTPLKNPQTNVSVTVVASKK